MRLGLHISTFSRPGGAQRLGPVLADIAWAADEAGSGRISVMDHVWQIHVNGQVLYRFTGDLAETERQARRPAGLGVTVMHGPVRESWPRTGEFAQMVEAVAAL
ncbi:hypothetical protein [Actinoplanes philippinensis]|uniref:hypothetical protein n=1 Tax=Actinoplanes philippinensis TaxID=35752 RepID=UPI0033FE53DE